MPELPSIAAPILTDLTDRVKGPNRLVRACPASNGDVYVLVDRSLPDLPPPPDRPDFPRATHDRPATYEVLRVHSGGVDSVTLSDATAFHFAQPVPEGLLLVGARCHWTPGGPEENALICDPSGNVIRRFTLGDGIQDVRTTGDGTTWVSYFDEGVFGNYGWNDPGPEPVGSAGLLAFDTTGHVLFKYDALAAGTDSVCDLYALNVSEPEVWAYFYTEFPLVRIRDGRYSTWRPGVSGAHALAVSGQALLLYGGYQQRDRACVVRLHESSEPPDVLEARLVDDDGQALAPMFACGVGDRMHLFDGRVVRTVEARAWI